MKKNILIFILGGIFFSCISVYATISYQASQINYNNTTLDLALDNLYTTQNTTINTLRSSLNDYETLSIDLITNDTGSGHANGQFMFNSNNIRNKYRYFKVIEGNSNTNTKAFFLRASTSAGSNVDINFDTTYNTEDYNGMWVNVESNYPSDTSKTAYKKVTIQLFN